MTVYLLDTHTLYWHLSVPAKLSAAAKQAIADGEAGKALLVVSQIVLAELFFLLKKLGQDGRSPPWLRRFEPIRTSNRAGCSRRHPGPCPALPKSPRCTIASSPLPPIGSATILTKDPLIQASHPVKCLW